MKNELMTISLSLAIHTGLALIAARHFGATAIRPELQVVPFELISADIDVIADEPEASPATDSAARPAPASDAAAPRSVTHRISSAAAGARANSAAISTVAGVPLEPTIESAPPRFTITLAKANSTPSALPASAIGTRSNPNSFSGGTSSANMLISSANVDVPAKLRIGNVPAYTAAALAAGIEANVPLEIVISDSGVVTSARGLEHVGYGLDEAARQSVLGYRFAPAVRNNRAVAVRMRWLMRFQLR